MRYDQGYQINNNWYVRRIGRMEETGKCIRNASLNTSSDETAGDLGSKRKCRVEWTVMPHFLFDSVFNKYNLQHELCLSVKCGWWGFYYMTISSFAEI